MVKEHRHTTLAGLKADPEFESITALIEEVEASKKLCAELVARVDSLKAVPAQLSSIIAHQHPMGLCDSEDCKGCAKTRETVVRAEIHTDAQHAVLAEIDSAAKAKGVIAERDILMNAILEWRNERAGHGHAPAAQPTQVVAVSRE